MDTLVVSSLLLVGNLDPDPCDKEVNTIELKAHIELFLVLVVEHVLVIISHDGVKLVLA